MTPSGITNAPRLPPSGSRASIAAIESRSVKVLTISGASYRHRALLVGATFRGSGLAVTCDNAHAFVDPRVDIVGRAGLQERDAVLAASREDAVTRRQHLR